MVIRALAAAMVVALTLSGCGGIIDPSTNTVTPYSGTFEVGGQGPQILFSASKTGEFIVTLTALTPDSSAIIGMNWYQQTSGGCVLLSSAPAVVGRQALGGRIDKGNYCLLVYDAGLSTLSGPQNYSLRISVP